MVTSSIPLRRRRPASLGGWWALFVVVLFLRGSTATEAANAAPVLTLPTAAVSILDTQTVQPFDTATINDADGGDHIRVIVTYPTGRGTLSGGSIAFVSDVAGTRTYVIAYQSISGAQTDLRAVVFTPAVNRIPMTAPASEDTTFTVLIEDNGSPLASDTKTRTITVTPANNPPDLTFSGSLARVFDNATSTPFSSATIADPDADDRFTATITFPSAHGVLTVGAGSPALTLSSILSGSNIEYSVSSGTLANVQDFIRRLVFNPTDNRLPVSPPAFTTEFTTFTVEIEDLGNASDSATRSQEVESFNDAPTIGGSPTSPVNDNVSSTVFSALTVRDPDFERVGGVLVPQSVTVEADLGDDTSVGIFAGDLASVTFSGPGVSGATGVETSLRAVVYVPVVNRVPVGTLTPVPVAITATDSLGAVGTATPTFNVRSVNDAPSFSVLLSPTSVRDTSSIQPLSVVVNDPDVGESFKVEIVPVTPADFSFGTFEPATPPTTNPTYTGDKATIESALASVVYRPAVNLNANQSIVFKLRLTDVHPDASEGPGSVESGLLTLTILGINDPPELAVPSGIALRTTDDPNPAKPGLVPFGGVSISDPDSSSVTVTLRIEGRTPGTFSLPNSAIPDGNTLSFSGSPEEVSRLVKTIVFRAGRRSDRVLGEQDTIRLVVSVSDGTNLRTDRSTTVVVTAVNAAPVFVDLPASDDENPFRIDPTPPVTPFASGSGGVSVEDDDGANLVLIVRIDDPAKGYFNTASFVEDPNQPGTYRMTNSPAAVSAALQGLEFVVNETYLFPPNAPGKTTFALEATDPVSNTAQASLTIVLAEEPRNWLVTTDEDNEEPGSLRWVLAQIQQSSASSSVVTFALPEYPATIALSNGPFVLNRNVAFKGPGADLLAISGDTEGDGVGDFPLFRVEATVVMEGLTLRHGSATLGTHVTGGAAYVGPTGRLTMRSCVIRDSVATQWGGGIDVDEGSLTLDSCLVRNNRTDSSLGLGGGGVSIFSDLPSSILNSTFSGNAQTSVTGIGGGALYVENATPLSRLDVLVAHCTFAENTEAAGGGGTSIHANVFGTVVTVRNSIFADGLTRNLEVLGAASIVSGGGNVSDDRSRVVLTQDGRPKDVILLDRSSDALLRSRIIRPRLDESIGPVAGYPLAPGSAAINRGVFPTLPIDQRGSLRDIRPDAGALELGRAPRIVLNEIEYDAASGPDFLEFYVPRDAMQMDLSGFVLRVDGTARFTFPSSTVVKPGNGILVADTSVAVPGSTPVLTLPATQTLELGSSGVVELVRPGAGTVLRVEYATGFVDPEDPADDTWYAGTSITLAPQFRGFAYLPHGMVDPSPLGGAKETSFAQADVNSPGSAITTPFGSPNAYPLAVADRFIVSEDVVSTLDLLINDIEDDGADVLVMVDLGATAADATTDAMVTTGRGALAELDPSAVPLRGRQVNYDPLPSATLQALPVGAEATDTFYYSVVDLGGGEVEGYSGTPGSSPITVFVTSHRLVNGDQVTLSDVGTPSYNGTFSVTVVDDDRFEISGTFVDDPVERGNWETTVPRTPTATSEASVTLTILGLNDPPVPVDDFVSSSEANEERILRLMAGPIPFGFAVATAFDTDADYPAQPAVLSSLTLLGGSGLPDGDPDSDDDSWTLKVVGVVSEVHPIAGYSSADEGSAVEVESPGHGLDDGTVVLISGYGGYAGYNAFHAVTVVDSNHFTIAVPFVDDAAEKGVWAVLNDSNRLQATSALGADVRLDLRVDRLETSVVYNPRSSELLNALSLGDTATDHFFYAVSDSHGAVSLGRVNLEIAGVNDAPVPVADPSSLGQLDGLVGTDSLADVLHSLSISYTLPPESGLPGRADVDVHDDAATPQRFLLVDVFSTDEETELAIAAADLLANDEDVDANDTLRVRAVASSLSHRGAEVSLDGSTILYNPVPSARLQSLARGEPLLDTFEVIVTDDRGSDVTALVLVVVVGVNDTPVAQNDAVTTDEDTPVALNPITHPTSEDSDADIDNHAPDNRLVLVPETKTTPAGATVVIGPDSFSYDPTTSATWNALAVGEIGNESVPYTVMDGSFLFANDDRFQVAADGTGYRLNVLSNDRNLTGTGLPVADYSGVADEAPVTVLSLGHGLSTGMVVAIEGYDGVGLYNQVHTVQVLDADRFTVPVVYRDNAMGKGRWTRLQITSVTSANRGGTVAIAPGGGGIVYSPEVNYVGDEVFAYTVVDAMGNEDRAVVSVRVVVEAENGNLQANADRFTVARGQSPTLDVLANDNRLPATGETLSLTSAFTQPVQISGGAVASDEVVLVDNRFEFRQSGAFPVDAQPYEVRFTYEISGGGTSRSTAEVVVRVVDRNGNLNVRPDAYAVLAGSRNNALRVLDNDSILPGSGEALFVDSISGAPSHGTVTIEADGSALLYTPNAGFVGEDAFIYVATDRLGGTGSGEVRVAVGALTTSPDFFAVAFDDGMRNDDDGSAELDVLANDRVLGAAPVNLRLTAVAPGTTSLGTMSIRLDQQRLIFNPAADQEGEQEFVYTIEDQSTPPRSAEGRVLVVVARSSVRANSDFFAVAVGSSANELAVLANDVAIPDRGRALTVVAIGTGIDSPNRGGTVEVNEAGNGLLYTPAPGFVGEEVFTYSMTDSRGTDTARVVVTVGSGVLSANRDQFTVFYDAANPREFELPVLDNDLLLPSAGQTLVITGVGIDDSNAQNAPTHQGEVRISADGGFLRYIARTDPGSLPGKFFEERFTYEISDGTERRSQAEVLVRVEERTGARALETNDDGYSVERDSTGNRLAVLANDGVKPALATRWTIDAELVSEPSHGGIALVSGREILYSPAPGFVGTETFVYGVSDGVGGTGAAQVSVRVGDLPLSSDRFVALSGSQGNLLGVLANDALRPEEATGYRLLSAGAPDAGGTVSVHEGMVVYEPDMAAHAYPYIETFEYAVEDDSGGTVVARASVEVHRVGSDRTVGQVLLTIEGRNDAPTLENAGPATLSITDKSPGVAPFASITIGEVDVNHLGPEVLEVRVAMDDPAAGRLDSSSLGGFAETADGSRVYVFNGPAAAATTAIRGLVFVPTENYIPVPQTWAVTFEIVVTDPYVMAPTAGSVVVQVTAVNDPPVIAGAVSGQPVYRMGLIHPFASMLITEVDDRTEQVLTTTVTFDATHGSFVQTGGFTSVSSGEFRFVGTAAATTVALRGMLFAPDTGDRLIEDLTPPANGEETVFTVTVNDGFGGLVSDANTSIIAYDGLVTKVIATDGEKPDQYGYAVGVSGDLVAIGALLRDHGSPKKVGAIYLRSRNIGGPGFWGDAGMLLPTDPTAEARLGSSVAVSGEIVAGGAIRARFGANEVGAVYVYEPTTPGAGDWQANAVKLLASDAARDDQFGHAVAMSGGFLAVGSPLDDDRGTSSGSVYIFRRTGFRTWVQAAKIVPADGGSSDRFGWSVSLSGEYLAVGVPYDADNGSESGSTYVYQRSNADGTVWTLRKKVLPRLPDGTSDWHNNDRFGYSVSLDGDTLAVSSPRDHGGRRERGSVYVFQRDRGGPQNWGTVVKNGPSAALDYDNFGLALTLSRDYLAVGMPMDGVHKKHDRRSGSAWLFARHQGGTDAWGLVEKLDPDDNVKNDEFGLGIAMSGGTLVVGARKDDEIFKDAGSAYIYEFRHDKAPRVATPIPDQLAIVGEFFSYTVPAGTFGDADFGDSLTYAMSGLPGLGLAATGPLTVSGTPLSAGTVMVTVTATDVSGAFVQTTLTINVVLPEDAPPTEPVPGATFTYDEWIARLLPGRLLHPSLEGSVWGRLVNLDGDPFTNFEEYAFATPLFEASEGHGPDLTIGMVSGGRVAISFRRRSNDPALTFKLQFSSDVTTWTDADSLPKEESVMKLAGGTEWVTCLLPVDQLPENLFFRVAILTL